MRRLSVGRCKFPVTFHSLTPTYGHAEAHNTPAAIPALARRIRISGGASPEAHRRSPIGRTMADARDTADNSAESEEHRATPPLAADDELVERALRDRAAFGELYRRYLPRVYRYALARTGDAEQAQDVTAQTFLAALEGLASYRRTGTLLASLLTI